jgi:hypothetical protein
VLFYAHTESKPPTCQIYSIFNLAARVCRSISSTRKPPQRIVGYIPSGAFITPYLALRDYDQAFFWCEEAYKEQSAILQWLKVIPLFDPVRDDPRFMDLVHRIGLDKSY